MRRFLPTLVLTIYLTGCPDPVGLTRFPADTSEGGGGGEDTTEDSPVDAPEEDGTADATADPDEDTVEQLDSTDETVEGDVPVLRKVGDDVYETEDGRRLRFSRFSYLGNGLWVTIHCQRVKVTEAVDA